MDTMEAMEIIDAAVFVGDTFDLDADARATLRENCERWLRELAVKEVYSDEGGACGN